MKGGRRASGTTDCSPLKDGVAQWMVHDTETNTAKVRTLINKGDTTLTVGSFKFRGFVKENNLILGPK